MTRAHLIRAQSHFSEAASLIEKALEADTRYRPLLFEGHLEDMRKELAQAAEALGMKLEPVEEQGRRLP